MARGSVFRVLGWTLAAGTVALLVVVSVVVGWTSRVPDLRDETGEPVSGGVALLEEVKLGGMAQWVQVRGHDPEAPVLVWLHGGPGSSQMPFAHVVDDVLERHFVVVHWDQRGAGKSNPWRFDTATMREEQYVADTLELLDWIEERLGAPEVILLGHSWGTQFGIRVAQRYPERVEAWVGVGQVVHRVRANELAVSWLRETLEPEGDARDIAKLEGIELSALAHEDFRALNALVTRHGGSLDRRPASLVWMAARSPAYSVFDLIHFVRGSARGGGPKHPGGQMAELDLLRDVTSLDVPVILVVGEHDMNTPRALVEEFHEALDAPRKELIVLKNAAHQPFLAAPKVFSEVLIAAIGRAGVR